MLLAALLLTALPAVCAENTTEYNLTCADFLIRDPFVLVHDGRYYMYGTGAARGNGYGCCVSRDLGYTLAIDENPTLYTWFLRCLDYLIALF